MAETNIYDRQPLDRSDQEFIIQKLWPSSNPSSITEYGNYFNFFHEEISSLSYPRHNPIDPTKFAMQTYGDFAKVAKFMESNVSCERKEIAQGLQRIFPKTTEAQIIRSMEITARLWLTLHVRSKDYPIGSSSRVLDIEWLNNVTLKKMVDDCFAKSSYQPGEADLRINPSFTIPKLRKLCRIKTCWTHDLKDHLYYDRSRKTVHIYTHIAVLKSHMNEPAKVFPEDLLKETIRTLELLFPVYKISTLKFLEGQNQGFYRGPLGLPATDFGDFDYWRKRLMELHDVFHQAPKSIPQMWNDRRNPMQWWTFWLAVFFSVLTVIFGVISSYSGFWQLRHAGKSYELALLQACASINPPVGLCKEIPRSS